MTRKPVREFEVQFFALGVRRGSDPAPDARTFKTDDGRFEWASVPPGNYRVTTKASGYQRFEVTDLVLPEGAATPEIVMPLRAGHILRGRLYDETSGAGVAGGSVTFREADSDRFDKGWRSRVQVKSASDGSFVLDGVPAGRITLQISAQEYASRELEVLASNETAPLEIALSTGGLIAGRLTAADGVTPLAGRAGLFNLDQSFGGSSKTGDAGEFSYPHLSEGRYRITGESQGGFATRDIVLARNQRIEGIVLAVGTGRSIRGVVTGLRPEEMQHLSISVRRDDDPGSIFDGGAAVDERGTYVLHGVRPGRTIVVANVNMRRQLSRTVDVPTSSDITVNLEFPSGARLSGRVTYNGKPVKGVWLTPRPLVEQPVYIYGATTSNDGNYAIDDMAAGEYVVAIGNYRSRPFQIAGDTVFDVNVPLPQLTGQVFEAAGKAPLVGAEVVIWPAEGDSSDNRLYDRSDHLGQFELTGLEPGDFMLTAYKPGYEMFRKRISYTSPIADMTVRLRQETGAEVRAREADSGKPLKQLYATEMIGDRNGSRLQVHLNDKGVGYIPSALAGSTLSFSSYGYVPALIREWNGERLDLQLERPK